MQTTKQSLRMIIQDEEYDKQDIYKHKKKTDTNKLGMYFVFI